MNQTLKKLLGAAAIAGLGLAGGQSAHAAIVTQDVNIVGSTTWFSNNVYVLTNVTYVSNGAILTIEPGTVIRSVDESAALAGDPGALVITRGSKIIANGTVANPIIFTDLDDDNVPGSTPNPLNGYDVWSAGNVAKWGGLLICGKTYIGYNTTSPDPVKDNQIEGLTANGTLGRYGGNDDDDNSGELSYIQLRYGGTGLAPNNEINGLTMGGVGRGTKVHHIEVLNNLDDGFEFFGGTVNTKFLVAYGVGDDCFDTDEGYRGKSQFGLMVQRSTGTVIESGKADKIFETDGGNKPSDSQPYALSRFYNFTAVGRGASGTYDQKSRNSAWHVRDNAGPQVFNGLFLDFGAAGVLIDAAGGNAAINSKQRFNTLANDWSFHSTSVTNLPASAFYKTQDTNGLYQCDFRENVFYALGNGYIAANTIAEMSASGGGTQTVEIYGSGYRTFPSDNILVTSLPVATLTRGAVGVGGENDITFLDPRPVDITGADALTASSFPAPADGFFTPVSYKGAFDQNCMWTKGWTHITALGLLANPSCPDLNAVAPSSVDLTLLSSISFATVANVTYVIEASSDMINWSPIGQVVGDGNEATFIDERGLSTRQQYRVVVQ